METFMGVPIYSTLAMSETIEDWSRVRSPARARRRRRLGHKQNIVLRIVPKKEAVFMNGAMYVHPIVLQQLRLRFNEETGRSFVQ